MAIKTGWSAQKIRVGRVSGNTAFFDLIRICFRDGEGEIRLSLCPIRVTRMYYMLTKMSNK